MSNFTIGTLLKSLNESKFFTKNRHYRVNYIGSGFVKVLDDLRDEHLLTDDYIVDNFEVTGYKAKDTNPKDAVGTKKPPMSTVSGPVLQEVGVAMLEGALKYGRHNYRITGVRASVYYDATMRHLIKWFEGEDIDPDSGVPHVTKAIASLAVLRDAQINNMFNDDRPPKSNTKHAEFLQSIVDDLLAKYPNPVAPKTEQDA